MIRPVTLLTALMFVVSGAYMFVVKHHAQVLSDQIASTDQATRLDLQRVRVLQAQWALEVDPSRLAQLSAEFTTLQPMTPAQLVTLASLEKRLPPPGSPPPALNPETPAPLAPLATPPPLVTARANQPRPAAQRMAPISRLASAAPLSSVESLLHNLPPVARVSHAPRPLVIRTDVADRNRGRPGAPPASRLYVSQSVAPRALAVRDPITPHLVIARTAQAASGETPMDGGSMLGMAQTMSPSGIGN
ncbi:MAG: hypothetical protein POH28_09460 [Acidocella sp.]|nr:hypothetical protein [Acidocella sp.]